MRQASLNGGRDRQEAHLESAGDPSGGRPPAPQGPADPSWTVPGDVSEYTRVLLRWRRMILLAVGVAVAGSALFSLLAPETYEARVSLLPEQTTGLSFSSVGEGGVLLDFLAGTRGPRRDARLFLELLDSRTVTESVVARLGLVRVYGLEHLAPAVAMEEAVQRLRQQVRYRLSDAGIVSITARQTTRTLTGREGRRGAAERAAAIANSFAAVLDSVNQDKATSRARMVREYLQEQVRETEQRARALSDSLARMQAETGLVALDEQTKAEILNAGEVRGKLLGAEIELGILRQTMRPDNPQVASLEARVVEMRAQLDRLRFGAPTPEPGTGREPGLPFSELPEVVQRQGWVLQELKIQQTVYELLSRQYYQARVQETGEIPSFSVLDRAQPPVYRSWPKRRVLVLAAAFLAAFGSALVAFFIEYRERRSGRRPPVTPRSLAEAWRADRTDLRRLIGR